MTEVGTQASMRSPVDGAPDRVRVVLPDPEHASLLALLVHRLLTARVGDPRSARTIARMRGEARLSAGRMTVGLAFEPGRIVVRPEPAAQPRAWVQGDVTTLLRCVATGLDLRSVIHGRLKVGGDPRMLLRLWTLLRAPEEPRA
jgi:hypothetical protein